MISKHQIEIIIQTLKPLNPVMIGIFGSFARDENNEKSDIDILYSFKNVVGLFKLISVKEELEKKLNAKVDLVSEKYTHPDLKSKIDSDLKIIYAK